MWITFFYDDVRGIFVRGLDVWDIVEVILDR